MNELANKTNLSVSDVTLHILSNKEMIEVRDVISKYHSNKQDTIQFLIDKIGYITKRPLMYLVWELHNLDKQTRSAMRYLGDYIDQLIKWAATDILKNKKYLTRSLSSNLKSLKKSLPNKLLSNLISFDNFMYVSAKHYFDVPKYKDHLFSIEEVILTIYITVKLKENIIKLSKSALQYSTDQTNGRYYYDNEKHEPVIRLFFICLGNLFRQAIKR